MGVKLIVKRRYGVIVVRVVTAVEYSEWAKEHNTEHSVLSAGCWVLGVSVDVDLDVRRFEKCGVVL